MISYFLVFLFGILFLKNLSSDILNSSISDCNEIGHIHFHQGDQDHCHSGKSIFSFTFLIQPLESDPVLSFVQKFDLDYDSQNNFQSPDLEGPRKPPRI